MKATATKNWMAGLTSGRRIIALASMTLLASCEQITPEQIQQAHRIGEWAHDTWHAVKGTDCVFGQPHVITVNEEAK